MARHMGYYTTEMDEYDMGWNELIWDGLGWDGMRVQNHLRVSLSPVLATYLPRYLLREHDQKTQRCTICHIAFCLPYRVSWGEALINNYLITVTNLGHNHR